MTDKDRVGIDLAEWYPLLVAAGIPTPKTEIVRTDADLTPILDGQTTAGFRALVAAVADAGSRIGYPFFLRTGFGSGKHDWNRTCLVNKPEDVHSHIANLVEWSHLVDLFGLPTKTWAVRELLPTQPVFTAFRGMPITKERRYFVRDGQVLGYHPYFPPETIDNPSRPDWESLLEQLNKQTPEEVAELTDLSERVSRAVSGAWSVDWLHVPDRGWVCIDMAWAEESYCWREHLTAPTEVFTLLS